MVVERRRTSTHSLRQLFQNQWEHLNSLLQRRFAKRREARHRDLTEEGAVEAVVDGTNALLRLASGYKSRLRKSVRGLLEHVDELVAELPAPIEVGGERFLHDPCVNAFFVNVDTIRETFSHSHDLQSFFSDPMFNSRSHAFAVMFMNKVEREVLGAAMVDGILRQDVRKTTISFTDHEILQPRESEAQVRDALESLLFERFVAYVKHCLTQLGLGRVDESGPCSALIQSATGEPPNLKDPSVYLHYLTRALDSHRELLRLEASTIRVNRIGELVAAESAQVTNHLKLLEIRLGHHAHEVLTLVSYPREEMISQDELLRRASARLQY